MTKLRVQWNFGNTCNLDCNYCHPDLNSNSWPFPDLDKLLPAFDRLHHICQRIDEVEISILGGEPTYSHALRYIIENYCKDNFKFRLSSNGYAAHGWWQNIKEKLNWVSLTYHLSQDLYVFIDKADVVKDRSDILIAIEPQHWDFGIKAYQELKKINHLTQLQFLYKNFTRGNSIFLDYSKEQWDYYYKEQGIDTAQPRQVEKTIEFKRQNNLNDYYGHMCWAGVDQIIINHYGDVYRGWCFTGHLGNIYNDGFELLDYARPCPKFQCTNGFDLQARKSQGTWGMA